MEQAQLQALTSDRYRLEKLFDRDPIGVKARVIDEETGESAFLRARDPVWSAAAADAIDWEAGILGVLDHSGVPRLIHVDTDTPWPHLVTQLMPYEDSEEVDREFFKHLRTEFAAEVCLATLRVLGHVHNQGVVHRDLNRGNVLKQWSGEVALIDFEASGFVDQDAADRVYGSGNRPHRLRFESLWARGTPQCMSPEQMASSHIDARSDIYSMGVLFYEMLYNRYPFDGESIHEICVLQRSSSIDFTPRGGRDIPEQLIAIIDRATQIKPDDRFQSTQEMGDAVAAFLG